MIYKHNLTFPTNRTLNLKDLYRDGTQPFVFLSIKSPCVASVGPSEVVSIFLIYTHLRGPLGRQKVVTNTSIVGTIKIENAP